MRRLNIRERVLVGLLVVFALVYAWYRSNRETFQAAATQVESGQTDSVEGAPVVMVALLKTPTEAYDSKGRDLFQYGQRPPSEDELARRRRMEELRAEAERRRREAKQQEQEKKPPVQVAAQPVGPRPPAMTFQYIGYLGPKDAKIAAFKDGDEVILAREGEVIQEAFRLVEISYENVVLGYTDPRFENQRRELPLAVR